MNPNSRRHQDMITAIAGHGAITGQMIGRKAWQHEANAAIANVQLMQDAGSTAEWKRGFGQVIIVARKLTASVGGALIRVGGRLQGGASAPAPATEPAAPSTALGRGGGQPAARPSRRFRMYMHTTPPARAHSTA